MPSCGERPISWCLLGWLSVIAPLLPPQRAPSPFPKGRGAHVNSAQAAGTRAWNCRGRLSNPSTIHRQAQFPGLWDVLYLHTLIPFFVVFVCSCHGARGRPRRPGCARQILHGRDAFHRVRIIAGEVTDAVERVPTMHFAKGLHGYFPVRSSRRARPASSALMRVACRSSPASTSRWLPSSFSRMAKWLA